MTEVNHGMLHAQVVGKMLPDYEGGYTSQDFSAQKRSPAASPAGPAAVRASSTAQSRQVGQYSQTTTLPLSGSCLL